MNSRPEESAWTMASGERLTESRGDKTDRKCTKNRQGGGEENIARKNRNASGGDD